MTTPGGMRIDRTSLKNEAKVTVPFNIWFSYPFPHIPAVVYEDGRGWHSAVKPERITPDVDGDALVMAKFNFRDILSAGATQLATRFGRASGTEALDITWTDELAAGALTDGLYCHTANGPQKTMRPAQYWVTQVNVLGPSGGSVVCETAEFILTGWWVPNPPL